MCLSGSWVFFSVWCVVFSCISLIVCVGVWLVLVIYSCVKDCGFMLV